MISSFSVTAIKQSNEDIFSDSRKSISKPSSVKISVFSNLSLINSAFSTFFSNNLTLYFYSKEAANNRPILLPPIIIIFVTVKGDFPAIN